LPEARAHRGLPTATERPRPVRNPAPEGLEHRERRRQPGLLLREEAERPGKKPGCPPLRGLAPGARFARSDRPAWGGHR